MHDRLQDLIDWVQDLVDEIKDILEWTLIHAVYWSPFCLFVLIGPEEEYDFWATCFGGDTPEGWPGTLVNMAVMFGFIFCFNFAGLCFFRITKPLWVVTKTRPECGHTYEGSRFDSLPPPLLCTMCVLEKVVAEKRAESDWPPWRSTDADETESAGADASESE